MTKQIVDWTDDQTATLTRMWSAGAPCSEIIAELGVADVSRSAIVGKAYRLGLPRRRREVVEANTAFVSKRVGGNNPPRAVNAKARKAAAESVGAKGPKIWDNRQAGDVATVFRTEDLKSFACRWPIGDPRQPGFGYCGAECKALFGYCEAHAERAFTPAGKVRYDKRLV